MLVFWLIIAALTAIALLFVIPPLRRHGQSPTISQHDVNRELYRAKLEELKQDLNNGLIAQQYYASAQEELARNLLTDLPTVNSEPATTVAAKRGAMPISWLLAIFIPVFAVGIYTQLSSGLNHAGNAQSLAEQGEEPVSVEDMIGRLAVRLEQDTDDLEGWLMLGRSLMLTQRYEEAVRAYQQANALTEYTQPDVMMALAESLTYASQGDFPARADELIQQVLAQNPDHQKALWLGGLSAYQRGEYQTAVDRWQLLLTLIPQDNGDLGEALKKQIATAQQQLETYGGSTAAASNNNPEPVDESADDSENGSAASEVLAADKNEPASFQVRVELSPDQEAMAKPDYTVFIYASAAHGPRMPLSLVRKQVKDLPLLVTLDDSTAMIPEFNLSSQESVTITARISKSGQAQPQSGDLIGVTMPLETGQNAEAYVLIDQEVN